MEERKFCMKSRAELDEIRKQQASKKASVNEEFVKLKDGREGHIGGKIFDKDNKWTGKYEFYTDENDYEYEEITDADIVNESKINEISDEVVKRSEEKRYKDMETARAKEDKAFDKYANARTKWKKGTTAQGGANLDDISDYMNADIEWQKAREEDKKATKKWSRNISLAGARDRRRQAQAESLTASKALTISKSILDEISDELADKVYQKRKVNQIRAKQKAMDMVMDKNASVSDVNKALDDSDIADEKKARNVDLYYSRIARKHYANKNESKINEEKIQPSEIYDLAVANLPAEDIDHHQSDLYIRKTPESTALIKQMGDQAMLSTFRDNIDGDIWYDLPFCYTPHWNKSESKINEISDKENKMINNIDKMMANPKNLDPETNEIKSKKLNKELNNLSVYQNRIYSTDSLKEMMSLLSSSTLREKDKETILKAVDNFIDYLNGYIEDNEL